MKPSMTALNTCAYNHIVMPIAKGQIPSGDTVGNFFRYANERGLQGNVMTAIYSSVNKALALKAADDSALSFKRVANILDFVVKRNPEIKKDADTFVKAIEHNYNNPKNRIQTLPARICILTEDAVNSHREEIKPTSKFKKFFMALNKTLYKIINEDE